MFQQNGITNIDLSNPLSDDEGNLRVLFAGEATDASYYGTVHGAMMSAGRNKLDQFIFKIFFFLIKRCKTQTIGILTINLDGKI
jgi:hypothetical protein